MIKKISCVLVAVFVVLAGFSPFVHAEDIKVSAKAAILINADNGMVIYAKDENERLPMASTTKVMTALITLEKAAQNNNVVTITDQMVKVEGSSMGLRVGYKLTLRDLAIGMLTVSGNDAANSAAIAISGSTDSFAVLMNQRAKELNLTNTHFVTPSGLDSADHYTTAADLARLGAAAIKNSDFASIVRQKQINVKYIYPEQTCRYANHNRLLSLYADCIGIKTGFTKKSGRCLVSAAEKNGIHLVAVTLNAPDDWDDHERLFDYGFSQLTSYQVDDSKERFTVPVVGGLTDNAVVIGAKANSLVVPAADAQNIQRTVEIPRFVYAPIKANQKLGVIRYSLNGKTLLAVPLTAAGSVQSPPIQKNGFQKFLDSIKRLFGIKT